MSGSGSLHSWNLETPEERSVSDWSCLEESVQEEDVAESPLAPRDQEQKYGQIEETKQEDVKEAIDGNQEEEELEESNNCEDEGKEEEEKKASDEIGVSSEEDGNKTEVEELKENDKEKENQIIEEDRSCEVMKELQQPQQRGDQEEKERTEVSPPHQNTAQEQQEQDTRLKPADLQSRVTDEPPQKMSDEAEKRPTLPVPKVMSAAAHVQSHAHSRGVQVNSRTKEPAENRTSVLLWSREEVQTPANKSKEKNSEEEEELPLIKVSELKKRFEAEKDCWE